jgi:CBS domain containing-hemolysin-like protein
MFLLLLWVGLAVGISFLCSLLEAVLLSVRRTALVDADSSGAALLLRFKSERLDDAIAAILTLNTISHTIGAALAGAQAAHVAREWGWGDHETMVVGVFSAILTLLVLALSEIVPKTLGAVYAATLAAPVGHTLRALVAGMGPLLILTRALTRLITRKERAKLSRGEVRAFLSVARGEGALAPDEERWHANLLELEELRVADVFTPRTVVQMLPEDATAADLVGTSDVEPFSRLPLYRETRDNVTGYVYQRDVLRAVARGASGDTPLREFARPVHFVPETATIRTVLRDLLGRNAHFAMALDEHGGVAGLVSLEDLVETLFGTELTDETDREADLREAALKLRDRRLSRARRGADGGRGEES